jgi:hypothetical protein
MAIATVIIPVGPRHLHLLPRAVHSAYAQTVPVDVLWHIDQQRRGPAHGRNLLAKRVKTPFIVQLDADDYLLPHAVETWLKHWQPGFYVTSDWFQGATHTHASSCYGLYSLPGEVGFHLPPSLFPTSYWHALGGQDETMFGAEDSESFFRANAARIKHVIVREPLFHYTPDGYRSKEAAADPKWQRLINGLFAKYRKDMTRMGCCGDVADPSLVPPQGSKVEGDVLARPTWHAAQKTVGKKTGRKYGVISQYNSVWIDPRDVAAQPGKWVLVEDWDGLAPTKAEMKAALKIDPNDPVAMLEHEVKQAGIRTSWEPVVTSGYDIQQTPHELAEFILFVEKEHGQHPTMLEIGTGSSGGLARFLTDRGWTVTSIDLNEPVPVPTWEFIQGDSREVDLGDRKFDVVFIDGDHEAEGVKSDHERFGGMGKIVAFHDIAEKGWWPETAAYWRNLAYTEKGNRRKGYYESLVPQSAQGLGWYVRK